MVVMARLGITMVAIANIKRPGMTSVAMARHNNGSHNKTSHYKHHLALTGAIRLAVFNLTKVYPSDSGCSY